MKRIFFDVTDIVQYVKKETSISGIQRVSFEVIKRAVQQLGPDVVKLSYWDRTQREYVAIDAAFLTSMDEFSPDALNLIFSGREARPHQDAAPTLSRYRNYPLKYAFHSMVRSYHAMRGDEAHFAERGSSIAEWRAFKKGPPKMITAAPTMVKKMPVVDLAQPGDQLVILGAVWGIKQLDDCFQSLKDQSGMDIYQLIHDLIPLVTPEHIASDFSQRFYYWLETSTRYCTGYFTNSQNTAKDLRVFMAEIDHVCPVIAVPLAQKFNVVSSDNAEVGTSIRANLKNIAGLDRSVLNLSKYPYVLVVGTLESRKNLWRLAQAWQRLSTETYLDVPKLVFAGKRGWYNDDFEALMKATGDLGGWVQFVDRPSDTELGFLYENCLFTATVSFYEGWGLPIGESLSFGKTAVVADNSSQPEVGGDLVEYCDAHSIDSIYAACRRLIDDVDHRKRLEAEIAAFKLRTWNDVAEDLIGALSE